MDELKRGMARIQTLVGDAFNQAGGPVALSDGKRTAPEKLQRTLEQTIDRFERSILELRRLCETCSPGVGGYQRKTATPPIHAAGYVEQFGYGWLHIVLSTLLPHCRYQAPAWLSDALTHLLDDYGGAGRKLPYFQRAMLMVDGHSSAEGRHVYDSDNKGWKAVSNAPKSRLFPDDDQYTLTLSLLSTGSTGNVYHITLLDLADAADFFAVRSGDYRDGDFYFSRWTT